MLLQSRNQIVDPTRPEQTSGVTGTFDTPYPATQPGLLHARFSDSYLPIPLYSFILFTCFTLLLRYSRNIKLYYVLDGLYCIGGHFQMPKTSGR